MNVGRVASLMFGSLCLCAAGASCSSNGEVVNPLGAGADAGTDGGGAGPTLTVACDDAQDSVFGDPGPVDKLDKGAIIRCAKMPDMSADDLLAKLKANDAGYEGKPFESGAKVYRILYRTERGTQPPTAGYSSATIFLPMKPRAAKVPMIIGAHGARGQGPACAPSKLSPEGEYVRGDWEALAFPIVGHGFPIIVSDLAGYANYGAAANPPPAFASVDDVGRSTLDSSRALKALVPSMLTEQVVLLGISQGGHSVLGSLAISPSYGAAAPIVAVATYSPLWTSQRSWGAIFLVESSHKLNTDVGVPVSIWYNYTHAELLDGPGSGVLLFKESVRPAIKQFAESTCWAKQYPDLAAVGSVASDFFDPTFVSAVSAAAGMGANCPTEEPKKSLCEKWIARYLADRPSFPPEVGKIPILIQRGGKDTTLPPEYFQCVVDRFTASGNPLTYCFDPNLAHSDTLRHHSDFTVDWIANKTLGTPITATCPDDKVDARDATGAPVKCTPIPPND